MARIEGVSDAEAGLVTRGVYRATERMLRRVPEPLRIMAHSKPVMWADVMFELALQRAHSVPPRLKALAGIKAAAMIGCVF
jgi:hypothetical protein